LENEGSDPHFTPLPKVEINLLYRLLLQARLSRWGGSYLEMEGLAVQALRMVDSTSEMYLLFGQIYEDQGWKMH